MRLWPILLLAAAVVGYFIVANLASVMALNDIASRPILALTRDNGAQPVPVQTPGQPAGDGEARMLGGQGIPFGYRFGFAMPDGQTVTCTIRFRTLSCSDGWVAERPPG
jgi:hypothetical protein